MQFSCSMERALVFVIFAVTSQISSAAPDFTKAHRDLPIRYPGPVKHMDMDRYVVEEENDIPEECRDLNYCTVKPKNYPDELISEIFKHKKVPVGPPDVEIDLIIVNRLGDPNEEDNCASVVSYEPIYKIQHKNEWRTVVQAKDLHYEQKVRLEQCTGAAEKPCFTVATFPTNIRTKCVQKYSTWKLQTLDKNNKTEISKIDLPTCCSCHYEVIGA